MKLKGEILLWLIAILCIVVATVSHLHGEDPPVGPITASLTAEQLAELPDVAAQWAANVSLNVHIADGMDDDPHGHYLWWIYGASWTDPVDPNAQVTIKLWVETIDFTTGLFTHRLIASESKTMGQWDAEEDDWIQSDGGEYAGASFFRDDDFQWPNPGEQTVYPYRVELVGLGVTGPIALAVETGTIQIEVEDEVLMDGPDDPEDDDDDPRDPGL
jgi:hypothetical protein